MPSELKPPIILFGNTRSGTTIVQKVISAHPNIVDWYEPNPIWLYADPGRQHDEFDETDVTDKVKNYIRKRFFKYQKENGNRIVMEKTPQNVLRVPYVRSIFPDAIFLFIIRNPFSFISSVEYKWQKTVTGRGIMRRLKDTPVSHLHYYFARYLVQIYNKRILKRKYLSVWGPRYNGIQNDLKNHDLLTVITRQWAIGSKKAEEGFEQFEEGNVLRLKYENFVTDPLNDLERICSHCSIEMTKEMMNVATESVKPDRMDKWRRFEPHVLGRILPEIEGEMKRQGYEIPIEIYESIANLNGEKAINFLDTTLTVDPVKRQ